jgi:hypothetical protein
LGLDSLDNIVYLDHSNCLDSMGLAVGMGLGKVDGGLGKVAEAGAVGLDEDEDDDNLGGLEKEMAEHR